MKQRVEPHKDAMVETILTSCAPRAGEEDFWLIMVRIAASERPIFALNGRLRPIAEHTVKMIWSKQISFPEEKGGQLQFLTFQGEKARAVAEQIEQGVWPALMVSVGNLHRCFGADPKTTCIAFDPEYVTS